MIKLADLSQGEGAILYYAPDDWTIWLQNAEWTPGTSRPGLRVTQVTADEVRLTLAPPLVAAPRDIALKPYQTYRLSSGVVAEGSLASLPDMRSSR